MLFRALGGAETQGPSTRAEALARDDRARSIGEEGAGTAGGGTGFDGGEDVASEKESQSPIESGRGPGLLTADIVEGEVGGRRLSRIVDVDDGEVHGTPGVVYTLIGGGQIERRGRAVKALRDSAQRYFRDAGRSTSQEKDSVRAAIDEAAGILDTLEDGGKGAALVGGEDGGAAQSIV